MPRANEREDGRRRERGRGDKKKYGWRGPREGGRERAASERGLRNGNRKFQQLRAAAAIVVLGSLALSRARARPRSWRRTNNALNIGLLKMRYYSLQSLYGANLADRFAAAVSVTDLCNFIAHSSSLSCRRRRRSLRVRKRRAAEGKSACSRASDAYQMTAGARWRWNDAQEPSLPSTTGPLLQSTPCSLCFMCKGASIYDVRTIRRALAAANVVKESGCLFILSVSLVGNPISRALGHNMGLPSNDTLKMQRQPAPRYY